jgi:leader peptidase (prepilin peptidase) / N-methyltransferase
MTTQLFRPALAGIAFIPAAAAAVADWRTHRVPDGLVALTLVPALLAVLLPVLRGGDPTRGLLSLSLGAIVMAVPLLLVHLVAPAAMGFGDVKLAAGLGAGLGVLEPELAIPALAVASVLALAAAAWKRRSAMPFGPALVAGAAASLALAAVPGWSVA